MSAVRRMAAQVVGSQGTLLAHIAHELHQVAYTYEGLTEKEQRYLVARHKAVLEEMQRLSKVRQRLLHHG